MRLWCTLLPLCVVWALLPDHANAAFDCHKKRKCSTKEDHPVCGTDKVTYKNNCSFQTAMCHDKSLKKAHDGKCCERKCDPAIAYVCGSDGKTYDNKCLLNNWRCTNPKLARKHDGKCVNDPGTSAPPSTGSGTGTGGPDPSPGPPPMQTCATLQCPEHTQCMEEANQPAYCADVCDPGRCQPDQMCELLQPQCVTAPCPPIARCVQP